jgi:hypothetical protein
MNGPLTCSTCRLRYEPKLTNIERQVTRTMPPRATDNYNQWPRELPHTNPTIPSEQEREPRPQPTSTQPEQITEHDENETQEEPVTTLRQNCTRLGAVFSHRLATAQELRRKQNHHTLRWCDLARQEPDYHIMSYTLFRTTHPTYTYLWDQRDYGSDDHISGL